MASDSTPDPAESYIRVLLCHSLAGLPVVTDMRVGMVGALPFLAAFVTMQLNGWRSDKQAERRWHAAMPLFVAGIAYFFLSVPGH